MTEMVAPPPDGERWRPIPGYEDCYEVSNQGNVKSLDRVVTRKDGRRRPVKARTLKIHAGPGGPGSVVAYLWREGVRREYSVARLVFTAFVADPPPRMPRRQ